MSSVVFLGMATFSMYNASSCAVSSPHRAAISATTAPETYDGDAYPRSRALRLTREADAQLVLREVDAAVHSAEQALQTMGGVTSARGTTILTDLRGKLRAHQHVPMVRDFLERTV